jgi:2-haloacid dehalogenase
VGAARCAVCEEEPKKSVVVVFDLYGTLVDWKHAISSFLEFYVSGSAVGEFFKCDIEKVKSGYKPYKQVLGECLAEVAAKHNVVVSDELVEAFVLSVAKSPPFPDTIYGLKLLKKAGYKTCILSNTDRDLIDVTLSGVKGLVDYVITAEDVRAYKPNPQAFERAYKILSITPEEAIHVSAYIEYDLLPASRLGAKTVLLDRGLGYDWPIKAKNVVELVNVLEALAE